MENLVNNLWNQLWSQIQLCRIVCCEGLFLRDGNAGMLEEELDEGVQTRAEIAQDKEDEDQRDVDFRTHRDEGGSRPLWWWRVICVAMGFRIGRDRLGGQTGAMVVELTSSLSQVSSTTRELTATANIKRKESSGRRNKKGRDGRRAEVLQMDEEKVMLNCCPSRGRCLYVISTLPSSRAGTRHSLSRRG